LVAFFAVRLVAFLAVRLVAFLAALRGAAFLPAPCEQSFVRPPRCLPCRWLCTFCRVTDETLTEVDSKGKDVGVNS